MPHSPSPVTMDMEHLRQYLTGDPEEEKEIIAMFGEVSEDTIAELRGLLADGQSDAWKKAAHKLKGAAANFGANALSKACHDAELNHALPIGEKEKMLAAIERCYEEVKQFFTAMSPCGQ